MNSMKLNPVTEKFARTGEPVLWGDIDRYIRAGERARAEYIANAVIAASGKLRGWIGSLSPEARAQAKAERASRRLKRPEFSGSPARGFFWPRLSWVAHEGGRWLGLMPERKDDGKDQRAA